MRRVRFVVAALLAATALPATADGPAETRRGVEWQPGEAVRRHAEFARRPGTQTYRAALRAGLEGAGFTAASTGEVAAMALPVGDLDGDRLADVVEIAYDRTAETAAVRARRGVDGRVLWSKSAVPGFPYVMGAKLGAAGAPGVLLVTDDYETTPAGDADTVVLNAFDGRGGMLWAQTFRGVFVDSDATFGAVGLPEISAVIDGLVGPAEDVVLTLHDFAFSPASSSGAATTLVIDGATGHVTPIGVTDIGLDGMPFAMGVPDLSGDGYEDVLLAAPPSGPANPRLAAYEATGVLKWARSDLMFDVVAPVGDLTGDRRGDLGVAVHSSSGGYEQLVVSGADGTGGATVPGEYAYPLGDADRDGRADLGTVGMESTPSGMGVVFRAFRNDGRRIYERRVTRPMGGSGGIAAISAGVAGDVQPDGVLDLTFTVATASLGGTASTAHGVVDGRTGAVLHARRPYDPLYTAVDARGDDFADATVSKPGVVTVTAQQGSTGAVLWQASLRHAGFNGKGARVDAASLDADRCADVIVAAQAGSSAVLLAIRGKDGRLLWGREITASGERPYGGLVPGPDRNRGC